MNMNCSVNFETHSLVVSRSFLKKASIPFSKEYEILARLAKQHPDFTIQVKVAATRRPQFMPTYEQMMWYMRAQEDAEALLEEFDSVRQMGRMYNNAYMYVRQWFLTRFPEKEQAA